MAGPTLEREATASTPRSLGSTKGGWSLTAEGRLEASLQRAGWSLTAGTTVYHRDLRVLVSVHF